jgi:ubiquinone/menaquinone biosynthesis C-methylase UbiE
MNFEKKSYDKHGNLYKDLSDDEKELARYEKWFDNYTIDLWRHLGMFSVLNPFLEEMPNAKWITIADGRFGTAATYIEKKGGDALAMDIDDKLLKVAAEKKMIKKYARCNAEALPYKDNEFDFSYCKQSFHHFPRPYIALYEMMRVSKHAIMLSEPAEWIPLPIVGRILQLVKITIKKLLGKTIVHHDTGNYEPVGNYVYSISEREIEKIAVALNFPAVAFKRYNDIYIPGVEDVMYDEKAPLMKQMRKIERKRKLKQALGLQRPNNIQVIIFKTAPSENVIAKLQQQNYNYIRLPENPYI